MTTTLNLQQALAVAKSDGLQPVIKQEPKGGAYIFFEAEGAMPSFYVGQDNQPTKFIGAEDAGNLLREAGIRRCTYELC